MRTTLIDLMTFITTTMVHVLEKFYLLHHFSAFDPHVGDTACQIRAYMIARIKINFEPIKIKNRIDEFKTKRAKLIALKLAAQHMLEFEKNNQYTVLEFIHHIDAYFKITREEKVLFHSYFLTFFKNTLHDHGTVIDYEKISSVLKVSRKMAKKISRHHQLEMAHLSCDFICSIAKAVPNIMFDNDMQQLLLLTDDDGRMVYPCYLYTKIILQHAKLEQMPFLLVTLCGEHQNIMCFMGSLLGSFKKIALEKLEPGHPSIIITGESQLSPELFQKKVDTIGMEEILLSAMAAHSQYTGRYLSEFSQRLPNLENIGINSLDEEMYTKRIQAQEMGCSLENPVLFLVKHIFCGTYNSCS